MTVGFSKDENGRCSDISFKISDSEAHIIIQ